MDERTLKNIEIKCGVEVETDTGRDYKIIELKTITDKMLRHEIDLTVIFCVESFLKRLKNDYDISITDILFLRYKVEGERNRRLV